MRQPVVVVGSDLRQLSQLGVAFRGPAFAVTLAHSAEAVEHASARAPPECGLVVCLDGGERQGDLESLLAAPVAAVFIVPQRSRVSVEVIEAAGGAALPVGSDGTLVVASLVARMRAVELQREQEGAFGALASLPTDITDVGKRR